MGEEAWDGAKTSSSDSDREWTSLECNAQKQLLDEWMQMDHTWFAKDEQEDENKP
jgi:hypothetical protein